MKTTHPLSMIALFAFFTAAFTAACSSHGGSSGSSSSALIACKAASKIDSDCTAQGMPNKFDCTTASAQSHALTVGCVKEHADSLTDYDVCCPVGVEGEDSSSTSSSDGGTAKADSGGEAPLCSPKSGSCKSNSDCACGQSCYPTAVCSTCGKRCNFSCTTDQDCIDATKNTTNKLTRCVKTSPNYEIYACQ